MPSGLKGGPKVRGLQPQALAGCFVNLCWVWIGYVPVYGGALLKGIPHAKNWAFKLLKRSPPRVLPYAWSSLFATRRRNKVDYGNARIIRALPVWDNILIAYLALSGDGDQIWGFHL